MFFELQHDGFRALASIKDGTCKLVSRKGTLSIALMNSKTLPDELRASAAVLDGEIVCLDDTGKSRFYELLFRRGEPPFYAFGLLWCEGKDLRFDGLHERKRQLKALIGTKTRLLYRDDIEEKGEGLCEIVRRTI